jgi:hypothetical protein
VGVQVGRLGTSIEVKKNRKKVLSNGIKIISKNSKNVENSGKIPNKSFTNLFTKLQTKVPSKRIFGLDYNLVNKLVKLFLVFFPNFPHF